MSQSNPTIYRPKNILDVEVPPQLRQKKKCGITFIDHAFCGGFTPSMSILFTGSAGCGKTTFSLQLGDALTQNGHVVVFNTNEQSLFQVRMTTERIKTKYGFVPCQEPTVQGLIEYLEDVRTENPGKQIFLIQDSLQTLDDSKYNDGAITTGTGVRVLQQIVDWCQATYGIAIVIGQVTKGNKFAGSNKTKHLVDVHMSLTFDEERKSATFGERVFAFEKNRFGIAPIDYVVGMYESGVFEKNSMGQPVV